MKTEPTYTMDEVYEEAKKFAAKNKLSIKSKKGLPKGKCESYSECVLANLFGGHVIEDYGYKNRYRVSFLLSCGGSIPLGSDILNQFVTDFDDGLYPELIKND